MTHGSSHNSLKRNILLISIFNYVLLFPSCLSAQEIAALSTVREQPPAQAISHYTHVSALGDLRFSNNSYNIEKAYLFSQAARKPLAKELDNKGYIFLRTLNNREETKRWKAWLDAMKPFGIDNIVYETINGYDLYIRFADQSEYQSIYNDLISVIAQRTHLSREIINHTITKESNGNERAVSYVGAIGLTQTLPSVIHEIVTQKKSLGSNYTIYKKIHDLQKEIAHINNQLRYTSSVTDTLTLHNRLAYVQYQMNRLIIFSLIPDFIASDEDLMHTKIHINASTKKRLRLQTDYIPRIELLILTHGPLNLCFGMVHLALQYNTIEYYKAIHKIDPATDAQLAAQLAYNCGLNRTVRRIRSLGGWHKIFSIPKYKNAYLPNETAHYGYTYIKTMLSQEVEEGKQILFHPKESLHLRLCLEALSRSATFKDAVHTLRDKKLWQEYKIMRDGLDTLIRKAANNTISYQDIIEYRKELRTLPEWPLICEAGTYIELLVKNGLLEQIKNDLAQKINTSEKVTTEKPQTLPFHKHITSSIALQ